MIAIVASSVGFLHDFLESQGMPRDVTQISPEEIRAFILYLQRKRRFSNHPFSRAQHRGLSNHIINCYLRSIRAFWSWLVSEAIIDKTPFARVKIPKASRKVVSTFSDQRIQALLGAIDTSAPEGFRDYTRITTLLDTAIRVSELARLKLTDVWREDGVLKVMGKGEWVFIGAIPHTATRAPDLGVAFSNSFLTVSWIHCSSSNQRRRLPISSDWDPFTIISLCRLVQASAKPGRVVARWVCCCPKTSSTKTGKFAGLGRYDLLSGKARRPAAAAITHHP